MHSKNPSPRPHREPINPVDTMVREVTSSQREMRPILEHISQASPQDRPLASTGCNSDSNRLQEVQIQEANNDNHANFFLDRLFNEDFPQASYALRHRLSLAPETVENGCPSGAVGKPQGQLSRRLEPIPAMGVDTRMSKNILSKSVATKTEKRKTPRNTTKKKGTNSPLKRRNTKKQNVLRSNTSPRKKRCDDQAGPSSAVPRNTSFGPATSNVPAMVIIPSFGGDVVDFWDPPSSLP